MIIPLWITTALQSLYYLWAVIEVFTLACVIWNNTSPHLEKIHYTDIGLKYSVLFVIVSVFYFSYLVVG
jgi:hypothetical protein